MKSLRVGFVVQGEGRGHMTQALALGSFLRAAGHEIPVVLVGASPFRSVPTYFLDGFDCDVVTFAAPTQVPDSAGRGVSVFRTVQDACWRMPAFWRSGFAIERATRGLDVVVNFLDLVGGLARLILAGTVPTLAVAHNYLFSMPAFRSAPGSSLGRRSLDLYTKLTAIRADRVVGLSFDPGPFGAGPVEVAPPLLRPGLADLQTGDDGHLLTYALNSGYADEVAAWQSTSGAPVHCYVDGGSRALTRETADGFVAHDLDQGDFLASLARCHAYAGSAGFESVCEAFYLGKPALAVPTEGQLEQSLNAFDAERAGAARAGSLGQLDDFWVDPRPPCQERVDRFRAWVDGAPAAHVELVERTACGA